MGFSRIMVLLAMCLLASGCRLSEMAANRIVTAPNKHALFTEKTVSNIWKVVWFEKTNSPVRFLTVPVGPPEAKLKLAELPPGDYHMKVESKVSTNRHGKYCLELTCLPQTNASFTPLKETA